MNIVFLGCFAFRPKATLSARILPMAEALARRGHTVTVLIPPYDNPADSGRQWAACGVRYENIVLPKVGGGTGFLLQAMVMLKRARALRPDVLHVVKPVGPGALAGLFAQLLRMPWLVDNDDWEGAGGWLDINPYPPLQRRVMGWQEGWCLRNARAVSNASHTLMQRSLELAPTQSRSMLLPNGPSEAWRGEAEIGHAARQTTRREMGWGDDVILTYTGVMAQGQDLDLALHAFAKQPEHLRQVARMVFVGGGDGESALRALVEQLGLHAKVTWLTFRPHAELVTLLCAADIGLFPYRDTPINRAKCSGKVMDYMNARLPTLASDVGMMTHYAPHGTCGLLAPAGSVDGFAECMRQLIEQPNLRAALGKAAEMRIWREFGWDARIQQLEEAYKIVGWS